MLVAGIGMPFNPFMYRPVSEWNHIHAWAQGNAAGDPRISNETPALVEEQKQRIEIAAGVVRHRLMEARPDVIVVLTTDHSRLFSAVQVPQLFILADEAIWGSPNLAELDEPVGEERIQLKGSRALGVYLQEELVYHKFDAALGLDMRPMGQPDYGADISLVSAVKLLTPGLNVPVLPVFMNTLLKPAPNGKRCYDLGVALGRILDEIPQRVAIVASGGMCHDYHGARAGFVDDLMDEWVIRTLERGLSERMQPMFSQENASSHGGYAELRTWLAASAAMETVGAKALPVDYFSSLTAAAGIGFVFWPVKKALFQ